MNENIVHIDLAKIDEEIESLKKQIEDRQNLKRLAELFGVRPNGTVTHNGAFVKTANTIEETGKGDGILEGLSITQFIVEFVKLHRVETRDIVKAYAGYTGKEVEDIRNNVNNALSRIKNVYIVQEWDKHLNANVWGPKK